MRPFPARNFTGVRLLPVHRDLVQVGAAAEIQGLAFEPRGGEILLLKPPVAHVADVVDERRVAYPGHNVPSSIPRFSNSMFTNSIL